MKEELLLALVKQLIESNQNHSPDSSCAGCCDCTTVRGFEHTAVRFNEQAAFNQGESMKAQQQQNAAQFASLLKTSTTILIGL